MRRLVVVVSDVVFHVIVLLPLRLPFHWKAFCHLFVFTSCDFHVMSACRRFASNTKSCHTQHSLASLIIFLNCASSSFSLTVALSCFFISIFLSLPSLFPFPPQFPSFITISFCTSFSFPDCLLPSSFELKAGTIDRSSHQTNKYRSPEQMGWTNTGRCC